MFVYITCDFWRCVQKQTPLVYSVMQPWKLGINSIFNAHILRWSLERPNWEAPCYFSLKGEWATNTILQLLVDNHQDMVQLFLIQYTFQITVYSIWRERNWRRHGEDHQMVTHLQGYIDKCSEIFTIVVSSIVANAPLVYSVVVVVVVVIVPHYCFADVLTRFLSPLSRRHPSHSSCYLRRSRLHPSLSSLLLLPCLARNCL